MVSTSTTNPGITSIFNNWDFWKAKEKNNGYGSGTKKTTNSSSSSNSAYAAHGTVTIGSSQSSTSTPSQTGGTETESSSGSGITTLNDAASNANGSLGNSSGGSSSGSSNGSESSGSVSPLLQGTVSFEELIGEICNGIDLIFATKRSVVVVSDYESIYAEAKYLRDHNHKAIEGETVKLWQLEEGSYELDVSEYGFYNTVKVHYKNGTIVESYEDLVRIYGKVTVEYYEKKIDKTTAQMKAKAYLAAHVRDFDMSIKANILWDGDIDIGDIVTIENPLTMRDKTRVEVEKRDPEYYFVTGKNIEWEGNQPITGTLELRYGAKSPETKEVPESGTSYSGSSSSDSGSSGDIEKAIDEVGKMAKGISYSGACQTHDCVQQKKTGDCWGMSDFIACELKTRGVTAKILQYGTSYANNHRSVKYKDASGKWVRFPYRKYNVNMLFRDTDGVEHGSEVKSTC